MLQWGRTVFWDHNMIIRFNPSESTVLDSRTKLITEINPISASMACHMHIRSVHICNAIARLSWLSLVECTVNVF